MLNFAWKKEPLAQKATRKIKPFVLFEYLWLRENENLGMMTIFNIDKPDYVGDNSNLPVWQSAGHCPKPWLESYGVEEGKESYKSPVISLTPRPPRSCLLSHSTPADGNWTESLMKCQPDFTDELSWAGLQDFQWQQRRRFRGNEENCCCWRIYLLVTVTARPAADNK